MGTAVNTVEPRLTEIKVIGKTIPINTDSQGDTKSSWLQ